MIVAICCKAEMAPWLDLTVLDSKINTGCGIIQRAVQSLYSLRYAGYKYKLKVKDTQTLRYSPMDQHLLISAYVHSHEVSLLNGNTKISGITSKLY